MIQDIFPSKFDISFKDFLPCDGDGILCFDKDGNILVKSEGDRLIFPQYDASVFHDDSVVYLFLLDEKRYFLFTDVLESGSNFLSTLQNESFDYRSIRDLRGTCINADILIAFTAWHLWRWYADNRFCGRCAHKLNFSKNERALVCPECGNIIYPRINPAVIVGVINGDRLLITRYRKGYAHNALVAGFTEIGETLEQTVEREVMEETGIKVKNIRYYKSQPWGMAQDILTGFFCELDGDEKINMDSNELKYAEWVLRDEIELQPNNLSLTNEMMKVFKDGF